MIQLTKSEIASFEDQLIVRSLQEGMCKQTLFGAPIPASFLDKAINRLLEPQYGLFYKPLPNGETGLSVVNPVVRRPTGE